MGLVIMGVVAKLGKLCGIGLIVWGRGVRLGAVRTSLDSLVCDLGAVSTRML